MRIFLLLLSGINWSQVVILSTEALQERKVGTLTHTQGTCHPIICLVSWEEGKEQLSWVVWREEDGTN